MAKNKKLPDNQITVYQIPDGKINIEVLYANENIWLPQKRMAELFGCSADNVSLHLKNIYKEKELDESATAEDFSVVQIEGNREVTMYLDYAELQAVRNKPMYMKDWIEKLNAFLKFSEYEILTNAGSISHEVALALANKEYGIFKKKQDKNYISDFDKEINRITGKKDDDK